MTSLPVFLLARLDEDEAAAKAAMADPVAMIRRVCLLTWRRNGASWSSMGRTLTTLVPV